MSDLLFSAVFGSLRCRSFTLFTEDRSLRSLKILESLQALAPIYRALARSKFYRPQGRSNLSLLLLLVVTLLDAVLQFAIHDKLDLRTCELAALLFGSFDEICQLFGFVNLAI